MLPYTPSNIVQSLHRDYVQDHRPTTHDAHLDRRDRRRRQDHPLPNDPVGAALLRVAPGALIGTVVARLFRRPEAVQSELDSATGSP